MVETEQRWDRRKQWIELLTKRGKNQKRKGSKLLQTKKVKPAKAFSAKTLRPANQKRGRKEPHPSIESKYTTQLRIPVNPSLSPPERDCGISLFAQTVAQSVMKEFILELTFENSPASIFSIPAVFVDNFPSATLVHFVTMNIRSSECPPLSTTRPLPLINATTLGLVGSRSKSAGTSGFLRTWIISSLDVGGKNLIRWRRYVPWNLKIRTLRKRTKRYLP
jgi:hypothetical protein